MGGWTRTRSDAVPFGRTTSGALGRGRRWRSASTERPMEIRRSYRPIAFAHVHANGRVHGDQQDEYGENERGSRCDRTASQAVMMVVLAVLVVVMFMVLAVRASIHGAVGVCCDGVQPRLLVLVMMDSGQPQLSDQRQRRQATPTTHAMEALDHCPILDQLAGPQT